VKVVAVGTPVIVCVPLNVESTPETVVDQPTLKLCSDEVVIVATFDVKALLEIVVVLRVPFTLRPLPESLLPGAVSPPK
jgi:hypothetical protein